MHKQLIGLAVLATAAAFQSAVGAEFNPVSHEPRTARAETELAVIVKLRADSSNTAITKLATGADRTAALAKRTGLSLGFKRDISDLMVATHIELDGSST